MPENNKMTIIATKGTYDWGYPPFILASTAVAMDKEVSIFFTFYGLNLLLKDPEKLKVTPVGNPAMPMKMPFGPKWLRNIDFGPKIPNVLWNIPFAESLVTWMMKKTIANCGVAKLVDLRSMCQEFDVKFIACQMTVDLFGYSEDDFIDGVEFGGAATYFDEASTGNHHLYM
ncbi:MAG TPA: peroxiredoxin family protein [Gammaproteobacteria bacterium]|nr:DsrE/DsrF/DrsH-like family protein [Gammaproteobacteria bacterium]HAY41692.1 peroxiredoxin family protein [Gammaproteobacteria bacterium]|tara:strand:- start:334 stop:849 length:516 start_codon:yes stop_codon:yes gene_type:complete